MGLIDWTIANKSRIDVHRWAFLFSYAIYTTAWIIYFRLYYYFRESTPTESTDNFRLSIIWISRILAVLSSPFLIFQMIGFLTFYPKWATYDLEEPKNLEADFPPVVFRVVSRGDDVAVLQRGIEFHTAILKRLGATKWLYQLVVEQPNDIAGENIEVIVVPKLYATPNKTLYKARNLHYALVNPSLKYSQLMSTNDHFYLIHLDEETLITSEAMQNCLKFCLANKFRCGHGMITCGWHKIASPLATFVDSWTVSLYAGMMYTSYRLCHRAHIIKGGFFLLRNDLEAEINWDFGPQFTAEDFRLGRLLNSTKEPVEYIDGVVMEESPVSTMGLVKQRSRWLYGHLRDLYYSKEPVSLITISFLCVWSLVPFTLGTLLIGFFICPLDNFYPIFDDFIVLMMASEAFQHFYGAQLNFRLPTAQRLALTFCYITHIPLVVAMVVESCAVFHAIFTLISPTKSPIFSHTQKAVVRRTLSNKLR